MFFWLHIDIKRILLLITSIFHLLANGNKILSSEQEPIKSKSKDNLPHRSATSQREDLEVSLKNNYEFVATELPTKRIFSPHFVIEYLWNLKFRPRWTKVNSLNDIIQKLKGEEWNNYYKSLGTIRAAMFFQGDMMKYRIPLPHETLVHFDGYMKIKLYNFSNDGLTLHYLNNGIREAFREKRSIKLNDVQKNSKKQYPEDKKLRNAFIRKDMDAVQKLLDVEFLSRVSTQRIYTEDTLTFLLMNYFRFNMVPCEETIKMFNKKNQDKGDIDTQTTDLEPNYVIEIKCTKDIETADGEIIKNYDSDLKIIEKFIKYASLPDLFHNVTRKALNPRKEVMLLGLTIHRSETVVKNEKEEKKEMRYRIGSWLLVPYKYEPKNEDNLKKNINIAELRASDPHLSQKAQPLFD